MGHHRFSSRRLHPKSNVQCPMSIVLWLPCFCPSPQTRSYLASPQRSPQRRARVCCVAYIHDPVSLTSTFDSPLAAHGHSALALGLLNGRSRHSLLFLLQRLAESASTGKNGAQRARQCRSHPGVSGRPRRGRRMVCQHCAPCTVPSPANHTFFSRFLLRYTSRDAIQVLTRGTGGAAEARSVIAAYEDKSPLYGLLLYRRRKVLLKYVPPETSRLLQGKFCTPITAKMITHSLLSPCGRPLYHPDGEVRAVRCGPFHYHPRRTQRLCPGIGLHAAHSRPIKFIL